METGIGPLCISYLSWVVFWVINKKQCGENNWYVLLHCWVLTNHDGCVLSRCLIWPDGGCSKGYRFFWEFQGMKVDLWGQRRRNLSNTLTWTIMLTAIDVRFIDLNVLSKTRQHSTVQYVAPALSPQQQPTTCINIACSMCHNRQQRCREKQASCISKLRDTGTPWSRVRWILYWLYHLLSKMEDCV